MNNGCLIFAVGILAIGTLFALNLFFQGGFID